MTKLRARSAQALDDPALPMEAAATYAGRHAQTLRDAARAGELSYIRKGDRGHYRFRRSDLDKWLLRMTVPARKVYQG